MLELCSVSMVDLFPQAKFAGLFKVVHDHMKDCLSVWLLPNILRPIIPLKRRCKAKVRKNALPDQALNHKSCSYTVPGDQQNQTRLDPDQRTAIWMVGINPKML